MKVPLAGRDTHLSPPRYWEVQNDRQGLPRRQFPKPPRSNSFRRYPTFHSSPALVSKPGSRQPPGRQEPLSWVHLLPGGGLWSSLHLGTLPYTKPGPQPSNTSLWNCLTLKNLVQFYFIPVGSNQMVFVVLLKCWGSNPGP